MTEQAETMQLGETVYSKKLEWCATSGLLVKERYGVYSGYEGIPATLQIRKASRDWRCSDCGNVIPKRALHGSAFYDHFCADCITTEYHTEFKPR